MTNRSPFALIAALLLLALAAVALYRLIFYFEITIGDTHVGQTSTFFVFVICAGLSLALLKGQRVDR